jgi:hypothetical protein
MIFTFTCKLHTVSAKCLHILSCPQGKTHIRQVAWYITATPERSGHIDNTPASHAELLQSESALKWSPWKSSPSRKNPRGTRDLIISRSETLTTRPRGLSFCVMFRHSYCLPLALLFLIKSYTPITIFRVCPHLLRH